MMFTTWAEVVNYVENILGISYLDSPTDWVNAVKEATKGTKYVKIINETTGEVSWQYVPENMIEGVGEWHIGENVGVNTGGVKTAPTSKSIFTDSATKTAVETDSATGIQDIGLTQKTPIKGILGALMLVYGISTTAINVANSKVWKDLCNSVFDTEFTDDTPLDVLRNFLNTKVAVFTSVDNDELITHIPDSIAEKMYNFLASHMQTTGEHILEPVFDIFDISYRWINRGFVTSDPNIYSIDRYLSASNPDTQAPVYVCTPSDDLFKLSAKDYVTTLMGSGFTVPSNVGDALVASMSGMSALINDYMPNPIGSAKVLVIEFLELAGRTNVPKSVPIALSEISFNVIAHWYSAVPSDPDHHMHSSTLRYYNSDIQQFLASGEDLTTGDCVRYKKRNSTGASINDYGYLLTIEEGAPARPLNGVLVGYPSNELSVMNWWGYSGALGSVASNGYIRDDVRKTVRDNFYRVYYSNVGIDGDGVNYTPDDYLVNAGFRKNKDDKNPDPTKTKEEVYPSLNNKKQSAAPQYDPRTSSVVNNIVDYTPAPVIFGDADGDRFINYGINNDDEPLSYVDQRPQSDRARGYVNRDNPTDGFNEDTQNAIDDYNDSRTTPDSFPQPLPYNYPNPQYPTSPPTEPTGDSGDTPTPATMQGVTASGMVSIYNPTKSELVAFSGWLWSPNFLDNFLKLFANPMDAIIGLHILYATPDTDSPQNIIVGYLDSGVSAKVVNKQYVSIDCGTVNIPEYYGNAIDYEPYTQVHCYLPFIGIVSLKPNDVLGKRLNIKYGVDVLTGTCLAVLTTKKGDSDIACYNFAGNCAVQLPISGGSYAQMITGLAGFVVSGAGAIATGNPIMALGAGASFLSSHVDVQHSGSIGSNAGAMGVRKPYLIITRKRAYDANGYNQFYGYPANKTVTLGQCRGFTRVKSVHIDTIFRATDGEKSEIETLLREGVIIK